VFAYSTGGLTGSHDAAHEPSAVVSSAPSGHGHAEIGDAGRESIDDSRHVHAAEVAIGEDELKRVVTELDSARRATERYKDIEVARSAGYIQVTQDLPGIAAHFLRQQPASGGKFDPTRPQILLYTKQSGRWELVGVSYTSAVLISGDDPGPPPDGFSGTLDTWHYHDNLCFVVGPKVFVSDSRSCVDQGGLHVARTPWMLHVWLYDEAPEGVFAHSNSRLLGSNN
jgi:hypothetical protein